MTVQRYCVQHDGWVPAAEAQIIRSTETASGPGLPAYACRPCIVEYELLPEVPEAPERQPFIGRRDIAPLLPGDVA